MNKSPRASTATPPCPTSSAELSAAPAVDWPCLPSPATTDSLPAGVTSSTTLLPESAMNRSPWASAATPEGKRRSDRLAGPGVGRPFLPSPATTDNLPAGLTSSTTLLTESAMNRSPWASAATPAG